MSNRDTEHLSFIFIILLACSLWTHRAAIIQAEHLAKYVIASVVALLITAFAIKAVRRLHKRALPDVDTMTGLEFERYVVGLLRSNGYQHVKLTEEYDLGIDIIAEKNGIRWGIQVKRYAGLVGADAVRQVVTALKFYRCDKAMVISNSIFSQPARILAKSNNCILISRSNLRSIM